MDSPMLSSLEISHHIAGYLSLNDIGALDALESLYEFNARGHDVSQGMFQRGDDGQSDIENQQHPSGMRSRLGATASFCAADSDVNPELSTAMPNSKSPSPQSPSISGKNTSDGQRRQRRISRKPSQIIIRSVYGRIPLSLVLELFTGTISTSLTTSRAVLKLTRSVVRTSLYIISNNVGRIYGWLQSLTVADVLRFLKDVQEYVSIRVSANVRRGYDGILERKDRFGRMVWGVVGGDKRSGDLSTNSRVRSPFKFSVATEKRSSKRRNSFGSTFGSMMTGWDSEEKQRKLRILRKLDEVNDTSKVLRYEERDVSIGGGKGEGGDGLSRTQRKRLKRMLHYDISLKMFEVKVKKEGGSAAGTNAFDNDRTKRRVRIISKGAESDFVDYYDGGEGEGEANSNSFSPIVEDQNGLALGNGNGNGLSDDLDLEATDTRIPPNGMPSPANSTGDNELMMIQDTQDIQDIQDIQDHSNENGFYENENGRASSTSVDSSNSPFMCTPQSFPPTPNAREFVLNRSCLFAENVLFLARDQLRVSKLAEEEDELTRTCALNSKNGGYRNLAVFNPSDTSGDVVLTCGQHCASKGVYGGGGEGNLYSSTRCALPLLRNKHVYFEMEIGGGGGAGDVGNGESGDGQLLASLSIGISTLDMPLNTLVGSWKGSVGLCATGQILESGRWLSSTNSPEFAFGFGDTVGCLVYIDDKSEKATWEGAVVTVRVVFNIRRKGSKKRQIVRTHTNNVNVNVNVNGSNNKNSNNNKKKNNNNVEPGVSLTVPKEEDIYPTLSLHSTQTSVMANFSSDDIQEIASLSEIGVFTSYRDAAFDAIRDDKLTVYTVDGSRCKAVPNL